MAGIKKWIRKMRLARRIRKAREAVKRQKKTSPRELNEPLHKAEEKERVPLPETWFDYWDVA